MATRVITPNKPVPHVASLGWVRHCASDSGNACAIGIGGSCCNEISSWGWGGCLNFSVHGSPSHVVNTYDERTLARTCIVKYQARCCKIEHVLYVTRFLFCSCTSRISCYCVAVCEKVESETRANIDRDGKIKNKD